MEQFRFASDEERPIFTSNGIKTLFASGSLTQVSILDPDVLKEIFGAELILEDVTLTTYWQVGEQTGSIYRLDHFPLDGTDYDFRGLYFFNIAPTEEYKKWCKTRDDAQKIEDEILGLPCDIMVGCSFVNGPYGRSHNEWFLGFTNVEDAVKEANEYLQEIIDKAKG